MSLSLGVLLPLIAVLLAVLGALVGVVCLAVGLRGRRVDDHTLCRRCRHDLTGMPATSERCPECGADVRRPRATVIGHRRRRGGLIVAGVVLLLVILTPSVLVTSFVVRGVDWRARVPTWYELAEARGTLPTSPARAIDELLRRDAATPLTADQQRQLAGAITRVQRDPQKPWSLVWRDWVAEKICAGSLPAAERDAFLRGALSNSAISFRSTIRPGDLLALRFHFRFNRESESPYNSGLAADYDLRKGELTIDGETVKDVPLSALSSGLGVSSAGYGGGMEARRAIRSMTPGRHRVEWALPVHLKARPPAGWVELLQVRLIGSEDVTVVAAGASDVRRVANESLRTAMEGGVKVESVWIDKMNNSHDERLSMDFVTNLPADVAFEVVARQDGKEFLLDTITQRAADLPGHYTMPVSAGSLVLGKADIILRPSEEAARRTTDIFQIWDGELIFRDVPVVQK